MRLNGRAVRHSYKDKLVPRLTVNGFGPLINCDEWELIHNLLCSWPLCAVSVTGYKSCSSVFTAQRGKLLPPFGQKLLLKNNKKKKKHSIERSILAAALFFFLRKSKN